jgi:AbrB family looped-hinge helix DNA binding protein
MVTTRLTIDSAGRVVISKVLRDRLDLEPGATLELEATFIWNIRHYAQLGPKIAARLQTPP